jgi:hypothetical protein
VAVLATVIVLSAFHDAEFNPLRGRRHDGVQADDAQMTNLTAQIAALTNAARASKGATAAAERAGNAAAERAAAATVGVASLAAHVASLEASLAARVASLEASLPARVASLEAAADEAAAAAVAVVAAVAANAAVACPSCTPDREAVGVPCLSLVHIPKTGGTSMTWHMADIVPCQTSAQHCFDDMEGPSKYTVVVLRDPLSHVKSQFLMCRDSEFGKGLRSKNFPVSANETDDYLRWLRHFVSLNDTQIGPEWDFNCIDPRDTMTRHLSCSQSKYYHTKGHPANHYLNQPADVDKALRALRRASAVGTTSQLQTIADRIANHFTSAQKEHARKHASNRQAATMLLSDVELRDIPDGTDITGWSCLAFDPNWRTDQSIGWM